MGIKWGLEDGSVDFWFLIEMITIELIIIFDLIWFDLIWFDLKNEISGALLSSRTKGQWRRCGNGEWKVRAESKQLKAPVDLKWTRQRCVLVCGCIWFHSISFESFDWPPAWTFFKLTELTDGRYLVDCVCVFVIWLGWWMLRCYLLRVKPVSFSWPTAVWFNENLDSLSLRIRLELPWRFPVFFVVSNGIFIVLHLENTWPAH